jgi:hypothetical protein
MEVQCEQYFWKHTKEKYAVCAQLQLIENIEFIIEKFDFSLTFARTLFN